MQWEECTPKIMFVLCTKKARATVALLHKCYTTGCNNNSH